MGLSCLLCRESGHFVTLVDLASYVYQADTEASSPKNTNNEALLFIELVNQAMHSCAEPVSSKLS